MRIFTERNVLVAATIAHTLDRTNVRLIYSGDAFEANTIFKNQLSLGNACEIWETPTGKHEVYVAGPR